MTTPWRDIVDMRYPPGSSERAQHDAQMAAWKRRDARFEQMLGWMKRIPVVGWLMYVFWWAAIDEGYGCLDMVCFNYLADAYVPNPDRIRKGKWRMRRGYAEVTPRFVLSGLLSNDNRGDQKESAWLKSHLPFIK